MKRTAEQDKINDGISSLCYCVLQISKRLDNYPEVWPLTQELYEDINTLSKALEILSRDAMYWKVDNGS